jgi:hypothetical protein
MNRVEFDAIKQILPVAPRGHRLKSVNFRSCPGSDLCIRLARSMSDDPDEFGVSRDSWWIVQSKNLPDRTFRIFRGSHSMRNLLRRYGFLDALGCVNHRRAAAEYEPCASAPSNLPVNVPPELLDASGVPQFYPTSGICWLTATFWNAFANPTLRRWITSRMPDTARPLCEGCIYNRDSAEALRKMLWYDFAIGDNVEDDPLKDGRNGFSEFSTLCAKLRIPLVRLKEENGRFVRMSQTVSDRKGRSVHLPLPRPNEAHLMAFRFIDGDHRKFPVLRHLTIRGQRYTLLCIWCGHKKCGHQLGIACVDDNWKRNAFSDADMHKDGIGPVHIDFSNYSGDWWKAYKQLVFVTKFGAGGSEFCNLNPHNDPDDSLDRYRGISSRPGTLSIDLLYRSDP